ncbi:hypothetical protein GLOTRDRAFT_119853 [Gloeophyllum trabeum ATCC 11539]|uniref:Protection of telomeres protein 1 n=1 Tax=Gloeophyllum trabeum (strain ATCC 11539 / FP-39264 / Madison 617) TaxID=670483 RepID=S7RT62_GLOTA|nr:uncharacterized protein GLOTRDRAFT_119853 [Gloeophyllum trabeum ATCC 11539]EPQ57875.1 hypothetical protein GLOTRDRAFT_119853 [Gloeophyllum trabeum ATCC 11539]
MERESERAAKRRRLDDVSDSDGTDLFDPSHLVTAGNVQNGEAEAKSPNYIQGCVVMRWASTRRIRLSKDYGNGIAVEIQLNGPCAELWDSFGFDIGDVLEVSLEGASIEKTKSAGILYLVYNEGIALKYLTRSKKPAENGRIINSWNAIQRPSQERASPDPDDWFSTPIKGLRKRSKFTNEEKEKISPSYEGVEGPPATHALPDAAMDNNSLVLSVPLEPELKSLIPESANNSAKNVPPTVGEEPVPAATTPCETIEGTQMDMYHMPMRHPTAQRSLKASVAPEVQDVPKDFTEETRTETKKEKRARIRREKQALKGQQASEAPGTPEMHTVADPLILPVAPSVQETPQPAAVVPKAEASRPSPVVFAPAKTEDPALELKAGLRASTDYYIPLAMARSHYEFSTIAVVTYASNPERKGGGDWMICISLIDPSNFEHESGYGFGEKDGFKINCFTQKYQEWLPRPQRGDVVVLRKVKRCIWQGNVTGTGYHDKLRWAIYSPSLGRTHHGELGSAPRAAALDGGFGADFSPFWEPEEDELQYCIRLADWWQALQKERLKQLGTIHHISAPPRCSGGQGKQHRLICECRPDMEPAGFFNCTVEIVFLYLSDNDGPHSLYVTDYTKNAAPMPFNTAWCRAEFAEYVLKIEIWDAAKELCKNMQAGEYYSLGNIKFRSGSSGYYEGKANNVKCVKLHAEDEAAKEHPHLQALLRRKKEWEDKNASKSDFEHTLIEEIQRDRFIDCTVEVLHVVHKGDPSYLYVTDYTSNNSLPLQDASWVEGLENCVLLIRLYGKQAEDAKALEVGCYYNIRSLQVKRRSSEDGFQGRIGGEGRHFFKLRADRTDNPQLQALLGRKQAWQNQKNQLPWMQTVKANSEDRRPPTNTDERSGKDVSGSVTIQTTDLRRKGYSTLEEIRTSTDSPKKWKVFARIVDFFPLTLPECFFLRCTRCKRNLPANRKGCLECEDDGVDDPVCCFVRLFFRLQDPEGTELDVSACDPDCTLWKDFQPADPCDDEGILEDFQSRLRPFLGNLFEVHSGIEENVRIEPETSFLSCTVYSWPLGDDSGSKGYAIMDVDDLEKP